MATPGLYMDSGLSLGLDETDHMVWILSLTSKCLEGGLVE